MKTESLYTEGKIRTRSGKYLDVFNPNPDDIDILDIAWGLSGEGRFGNQLSRHYPVAEHSMMCADLAPAELKFSMLMHDASDAYIGDLAGPIKKKLNEFRQLEENLMKAIANKFGFVWPMTDEMHSIDKKVLVLEWENLMLGKNAEFNPQYSRETICEKFLFYFNRLTKL